MALQTQTRNADYVLLPASRFAEKITVSDAEAKQHYDDNIADFEEPARIKVDYIELSVESLAAGFEPSEAEIAETYEQTSERYKQAETRRASHILFSVPADADDEKRAEIKAQAEEVLAQAQDGGDFAELAKEHSGDPGSKEKGGDLGVVTRGQMVPPFEEAVFAMTQDEIRGPIETRFGYHIIRLTELSEERQKTLDEAREDVVAEARRLQAENQFSELGEAFENLVFEEPDTLTTTADELGITVKQSDWFTKDAGAGVAEEALVRSAAFSEDVLTDNLNSSAITLGFDRMVAVRKAEYEDAHPKPFDEVMEQIKTSLTAERAAMQAEELGAELIAKLSAGELTWDDLASEQEVESQALAAQRDQVPGNLAALGDAVFAAADPDGEVAYDGVAIAAGDYAIYALREVIAGKADAVDDTRRDGLTRQLLARDAGGSYLSLRETLREDASIIIDTEQIENPESAYQRVLSDGSENRGYQF